MEAREGYKKSKLGWIPKDWDYGVLGDQVELLHGHQFRNEDFTENGIPVIKISQVSPSGKLDLSSLTYISSDRLEEFKDKIIEEGDVLMSLTGNIGRVVVVRNVQDKFVQNYRVGKFIPKDTNRLDKIYMAIILASPQVLKQLEKNSNKTAQMNFGKQDMNKISFLLPPVHEQQKIAEVLTTVDDKIASIENRIQQTEQLKKGLLEKLMTEGIGHREFKDTEIGRMPVGWDAVKLGSLVEIVSDKSPSKFDFVRDGEYKFFKVNQLNFFAKYLCESEYSYEPNGYEAFPKGMVVFPKRGASIFTNKVRILGVNGFFDTNVMGLKPRINLNNQYLYYFLIIFELSNIADTSSVPQINNKHINPITMPLPSINEQKQIASILSTVDDKLDVLHTKKANYETLKKGLMEQLLTGKMRVKP